MCFWSVRTQSVHRAFCVDTDVVEWHAVGQRRAAVQHGHLHCSCKGNNVVAMITGNHVFSSCTVGESTLYDACVADRDVIPHRCAILLFSNTAPVPVKSARHRALFRVSSKRMDAVARRASWLLRLPELHWSSEPCQCALGTAILQSIGQSPPHCSRRTYCFVEHVVVPPPYLGTIVGSSGVTGICRTDEWRIRCARHHFADAAPPCA